MVHQRADPYDPEPPYTYECRECAVRAERDHQPETCPECGGTMRNLSVPRD